MDEPRIALIHATPVAMAPVAAAFARLWPEADAQHLLDDRLSADLARQGRLTAPLTQRFVDLARYAVAAGARGVLFTCSAFGPAIEAAGRAIAVPVHKPNEAMFLEALAVAAAGENLRVGLLSTFAPSIAPMQGELLALAAAQGRRVVVESACAAGALEALSGGDAAGHDRRVAAQAEALRHCDVVMLGQFSMARACAQVAERLGRPVLSSPDSAVRRLRRSLAP